MKSILRAAAAIAAVASSAVAHAQYYCPPGSAYYASNYGSSCTLGTCWATSPFSGSQSAAPLGWPGWYYSCATDGPPPPPPPAGRITYFKYDNQGNVKSVDGPLTGTADTTTNTYDALNRLSRVTDPNAGQVNYGYDALDQLVSVSDPRSLVTSYGIDGLGNLNQQVSPDAGTTTNTYDPAGNLLIQTDAKGQVSTYAYDGLNRVTLITFHDGSKQTYGYDSGTNGLGRLSSITETNSAMQVTSLIAYGYDTHGRVTVETRTIAGIPYAISYRYDSSGRRDRITYPSGRTVDFTFDTVGRINSVSTTPSGGGVQAIASGIAYHPFGGVTGFAFGNAQTNSRTLDQDGRISSYSLGAASYVISFDLASRITGIAETGNPPNTNTYGYDALDRLTSAVLPSTNYGYSYDGVGNRLTKVVGAGADTYAYSSTSNHIATLTPSSGPVRTFTLDANGSTTADGVNTYTYDTRGRMVQAVSSLGTTTYQVNALGQRVRKINTLGDRVFHYDSRGHLIAETTAAGANLKEYVWLGDMPLAVVDGTDRYYIHADHLNTPRLVANAAGQTVWRWDQAEPFGNNPADEDPDANSVAFEFDLRFPGQVWSKETQTSYNGHRDAYDPAIGRYPQSDPIGVEGAWSRIYAYRPRYLDVRAGRYVPEHPDRMNDARFLLVQGSMVFRHPLFAGSVPLAQEFNTYAYANLDPVRSFDVSGLQSESLLETPKGGGPSAWFSPMSEYERCVAQACVAGTIAGAVVGRSVVGAGVGFVGGFFLGGYFCPGDPINLGPSTPPGKTPPSAPPKN